MRSSDGGASFPGCRENDQDPVVGCGSESLHDASIIVSLLPSLLARHRTFVCQPLAAAAAADDHLFFFCFLALLVKEVYK
jgi:hypothetical protein